MQTVTLKVDDSVFDKFQWLISHFSKKEAIDLKLKILKNNPYSNSLLDIKKLSNSTFYRLRIND